MLVQTQMLLLMAPPPPPPPPPPPLPSSSNKQLGASKMTARDQLVGMEHVFNLLMGISTWDGRCPFPAIMVREDVWLPARKRRKRASHAVGYVLRLFYFFLRFCVFAFCVLAFAFLSAVRACVRGCVRARVYACVHTRMQRKATSASPAAEASREHPATTRSRV